MKNFFLLFLFPFLSFGQCINGDLDNDGICDEIDNCVGTWMADVTNGNCEQFTSQGADVCSSYSGCEWTYSWGGWVTGGSSDCLGIYEVDNGYCDELDLNNSALCDSIFISLIEYNETGGYIEIEVSTAFLTSYSYPYAGFLLTNTQGIGKRIAERLIVELRNKLQRYINNKEAKYDNKILLIGQLTTLMPDIYLDPMHKSTLFAHKVLCNLNKSFGSCEKSQSIWKK